MSAYYFLKYRGEFVRLTFTGGKSVLEIVDRAHATSFLSECDAWAAVYQHHLNDDFCEVVSLSTLNSQPSTAEVCV